VVTINGANDDPIAAADSNATAKKSTLSVSAVDGLLSNDTDPDVHDQDICSSRRQWVGANVGHAIAGTYGSVVINADGSYVYTADKGGLPPKSSHRTRLPTPSPMATRNRHLDLSVIVTNPNVDYLAGANTTLIAAMESKCWMALRVTTC